MTLGKTSGLKSLCNQIYTRGSRPHSLKFDKVINLKWFEADHCYQGIPSGKVTRSLIEELQIDPDESLFKYQIDPESSHIDAADEYVKSLPPTKGFVLIHYQGTSSPDKKNLSHEDVREICRYLIKHDYLPVLLDWDARSPLADQRTIFNPDKYHKLWGGTGTGCLATLTALISRAKLFIGVDSGPLHAAGATKTPSIGVWVRHHPIHFYELSHVKHLLPRHPHRYMRQRDRSLAENYFREKYWHTSYNDVRNGVIDAIIEQLVTPPYSGNPMPAPQFLKSLSYNREYYEQHKAAGCDYAAYGDWQKEYGNWVVDCMGWRDKSILDVGCACGAIAKGLKDNGSQPMGIDLNEHTINIGRNEWKDIPLFVGDSVNMHMFADNTFNGVHSNQVLEHLKPDLVPFVLREMWRIAKPGAILFSILDTENSINRQNRKNKDDDPTHVCIKPMEWWTSMLKLAGWEECSIEYKKGMEAHTKNFLARYDWDWFVAKKR